MPKWTRLVAGWAVAAIIAVAFSWGAVAQVRNRVIEPTVEIPTTQALAAPTTTATPPATSTPPVVRVEPEVVDTTSTTAGSQAVTETTQGSTATTTTQPTATTVDPPSTTTTTTTLSPVTTTTTTQPPPAATTTTTTSPPQTQSSSYTLLGGVVTISYSPGVVNFVSAIPQPGYSTDPRETGPEKVRIRFESGDHTSDFRAEWEDGELRITQSETDES